MFVENFSKFIKYYGQGRKIKLFCFFLLSLFAGTLEFLGVALIYPFILLILKPQSVVHTKYYIDFSNFFHLKNVMLTAFVLGIFVILIFIIKNLFIIFTLYLQNRFVGNWKIEINKRFMKYYLYASYKLSLDTSPSEKIYNLNFLIGNALDGFVFRMINLCTNGVIVIMLLFLLFSKFLFAALVTSVFVFVSISSQSKLLKNKIKELSSKMEKFSRSVGQSLNENILNIKEIKLMSAESHFYDQYLNSQKDYYDVLYKTNFYISIPPYIIETFVVVALLILAGIISLQNIENSSWMVASYAIVAASIFRIAPALNRIQSALNSINSSRDVVKTIIKRYEELDLDFVEEKSSIKINFEDKLELRNVYFSYKKDPVIKDLSCEIKAGEFVGIIGLSGAGKSTLADIIMGLLPVDSGQIFVDGVEIDSSKISSLRRLIGYVPQQVNIFEGSFRSNVAFGISEDKIDDDRVKEALKKAQLFDFVSTFAEGINANVIVGSCGLSQGQKQRLAIARALYRDPKILIFDEATSSLDVETEHAITQMLNGLKGEKTIFAIAHRLSTLKSCDRLIYMKDGKILDTGSFSELSQKYPDFEKLIRLSKVEINND